MEETTTTTTTRAYGTQVITKVRKVVSIYDEEYFCNRSWTLSYNLNTKSWISFHSYLPNWYIGENNFFYSGTNRCCDDFDFIAATLIKDTTTTSTTSLTTTITTTPYPVYDCTLAGTANLANCWLAGTAVEIEETVCMRPTNLITIPFVKGYYTINSYFLSTGSREEACAASAYLHENYGVPETYADILFVEGYPGMPMNQNFYMHNDTNDCTCIPDGWYFTEDSIGDNEVFHVVDCQIIEILSCLPDTTTTTTTTEFVPTTTTTTTTIIVPCNSGIIQTNYMGYPFTQQFDVGTDTGTVHLHYDSGNIPDRFIVKWDGNIVIDTGYIGNGNYDAWNINRHAFTASLIGLIDPVTTNAYPDLITYPEDGYPRVTFPTSGVAWFEKTTASPELVTLEVYAPIYGTIWNCSIQCPVTTTTTTTLTPTTTTTTTGEPTTTTTTTTGEPTTTTTTTRVPVPLNDCDVFLLDVDSSIYHYNPVTFERTLILSGSGFVNIAFFPNKLFILDEVAPSVFALLEYDINPLDVQDVTLADIWNGINVPLSGMVATNSTSFIGGYGNIIRAYQLFSPSIIRTLLFIIDGTIVGDVIYDNISQNLLMLINKDGEFYVKEYTLMGVEISSYTITLSENSITGLYCTDHIEVGAVTITPEISTTNIYQIDGETLTLFHTIDDFRLIGTAQNVACTIITIPTTTSTTTEPPTTTTTTTLEPTTTTTSTTEITTSTTTTSSTSTTTTTTTIIASICNDCDPYFEELPTTTTTTSTVLPNQLGACDIFVLGNNNRIYTYKPGTNDLTFRYSIHTAVTNIANTYTKMWLLDDVNNRFIELNIDYNNVNSYVFNRYITGVTRSLAGMVALSDTEIVASSGNNVYHYDVSGSSAIETLLFTLPAGRIADGDIVFVPFYGRFILGNSTLSGDNYITEIDLVFNQVTAEYLVPNANEYIRGIYQFGNLQFVQSATNSVVYSYSSGIMTQVDIWTGLNLLATSQYRNCVSSRLIVPGFTTTTTTTTEVPIYTICNDADPYFDSYSSGIGLLSVGNLISDTHMIGDYKINWHLDAIDGPIVFISGIGSDPTIQAYHPFINEPVQGGDLYPVIEYIYVDGERYTSEFEVGSRYSPDLITCLAPPPIVVEAMDCNNGVSGLYSHTVSYQNLFDPLQDASRSVRFILNEDGSTDFFAFAIKAYDISDRFAFYYCTLNDSEGVLLEDIAVGKDIPQSDYRGGEFLPREKRTAITGAEFKSVINLSNYTYTLGDYIKIEVEPSYIDPTNLYTNWDVRCKCLGVFAEAIYSDNSHTIDSTSVDINWDNVNCEWEITFDLNDTVPTDTNIENYLGASPIVQSSTDISPMTPLFANISQGLVVRRISSSNFTSGNSNDCENLGESCTVALSTAGAVRNLTLTFTNLNDFNSYKYEYESRIASVNWTNWVNDPTDIRYYKVWILILIEAPACGDNNIIRMLHVDRLTQFNFDDINKIITITFNAPETFSYISDTCESSSINGMNTFLTNTYNSSDFTYSSGVKSISSIYLSYVTFIVANATNLTTYRAININAPIHDYINTNMVNYDNWCIMNPTTNAPYRRYYRYGVRVVFTDISDEGNNVELYDRLDHSSGCILTTPSLESLIWKKMDGVVLPYWVAGTYSVGDRVINAGKAWESLSNNNIEEPIAESSNWTRINTIL